MFPVVCRVILLRCLPGEPPEELPDLPKSSVSENKLAVERGTEVDAPRISRTDDTSIKSKTTDAIHSDKLILPALDSTEPPIDLTVRQLFDVDDFSSARIFAEGFNARHIKSPSGSSVPVGRNLAIDNDRMSQYVTLVVPFIRIPLVPMWA